MREESFFQEFLSQFRAQFLKNASHQKRQTRSNCCQIVIPLAVVCLAGIFQVLLINRQSSDSFQESKIELDLLGNYSDIFPNWGFVADTKDNSGMLYNGTATGLLGKIHHTCESAGECTPYFIKLATEQSIDDAFTEAGRTVLGDIAAPGYIKGSDESRKVLEKIPTGAFIFSTIRSNLSERSMELSYTLQTGLQPKGFERLPDRPDDSVYRLYYANAIHNAFLSLASNSSFLYPAILAVIKTMPYTNTDRFDIATVLAAFMFPLVFSFLLPVFVNHLVMEKQERLREYMKIMGMKTSLYWAITFLYDFILYLCVVVVFLLGGAAFQLRFFTNVSPVVYILLFFFWGFALISLSFTVSALFNRTRPATVVSYLLVLISSIAGGVINNQLFSDQRANLGFLLYPPFALNRGVYLITQSLTDKTMTPLRTSDINSSEIGTVYLFLVIDALIWMLLALYLEQIIPKEYGSRKPWHFIFSEPYRFFCRHICGSQEEVQLPGEDSSLIVNMGGAIPEDTEDEDVAKEREMIYSRRISPTTGIVIRDLRKLYPGEDGNPDKLAIVNLCLSINKGECFGLLGPNGAGKTTTISILTGMYQPTSGSAEIGAFNILSDMDLIRKNLGVCPQHDILWEDLTVEEHLFFYARLKGVPRREEKEAVQSSLEEVGLADPKVKSRLTKDLSGGMKRRLSVAISLIGGSEFVFLDEPTTGLDPESRRHLWNIINTAKQSRCLILTTHSMEEADVLCSRIGIMAHGRLQCLGTQLHLKKKFGKGFKLSISVLQDKLEAVADVKSFVRDFLPKAELKSDFAGTLDYEIPREGLQLYRVFEEIEKNKLQFGIRDWSLNETSLEEVFLHIINNEVVDDAPKSKGMCCVM